MNVSANPAARVRSGFWSKTCLSPAAAIFCLYLVSATISSATLITFDELTVSFPHLTPVPNGYGGLQWRGFGVVNIPFAPRSGVVSSPNVAESTGFSQQISAGEAFDFFSGYFTAVGAFTLIPTTVEVRGLLRGVLLYDNTYTLSSSTPLLINFNYLNVDQVIFIPSTNRPIVFPSPTIPTGNRFLMDNLTLSVPDAGYTAVLIGLAIGGLAFFKSTR